MHSVLEQLENNQIKLLVEIPEEELKPEIESAFAKVSRQVRLPGFRPGRAPRRVLESKLGSGFARSEAISDNAPKWADAAMIEHEIEAISKPSITVTEGEEAGDVKLDVVVEVRPDLTLEGYGDLSIEFPSPFASEEDLDSQVEALREALGSFEDSTDVVGDDSVVTLDFVAEVAGDESETYEDFVLRIGADEPYEGLGAAIAGKKVGDTFEFEVSSDEPESADETTAGVWAKVSGTIKGHQALVRPELNDEFAKEASEYETLAELRDDMRKSIESFRSSMLRNNWRQILANRLSEVAGLKELPSSLLQLEFESISHNFGHRIENSGLSFAKYLELAQTTAQDVSTRLASEAVLETRLDLVLRALAKAEGLEATTAQVDEEIAKIAEGSRIDVEAATERLRESGQFPALRAEIAKKNAMDWIFANVKLVDDRGNVLTRKDLTGEAPAVSDGEADVAPDTADASLDASEESPAVAGAAEEADGE